MGVLPGGQVKQLSLCQPIMYISAVERKHLNHEIKSELILTNTIVVITQPEHLYFITNQRQIHKRPFVFNVLLGDSLNIRVILLITHEKDEPL
jgi:hypothetical protein